MKKMTLRVCAILLLSAATLACAHKNPPPDFAYDHAASFSPLKTYAWYVDPTSCADQKLNLTASPGDRTGAGLLNLPACRL